MNNFQKQKDIETIMKLVEEQGMVVEFAKVSERPKIIHDGNECRVKKITIDRILASVPKKKCSISVPVEKLSTPELAKLRLYLQSYIRTYSMRETKKKELIKKAYKFAGEYESEDVIVLTMNGEPTTNEYPIWASGEIDAKSPGEWVRDIIFFTKDEDIIKLDLQIRVHS